MTFFRRMRRSLALACAALLLATTTLPAAAQLVGNDQVIQQERGSAERAEVIELLERDDVQAQLEGQGVDPADAKARVAAMTDAEIAQLHARMEDMPAGSSDVLGAVVLIFVVFVITDVIGATDIFPFIRPAN